MLEKILFLPIDVQKDFYQNLSYERRTEFPRKIAAFSQKLEAIGIDALPVATWNDYIAGGYYEPPYLTRFNGSLLEDLTFTPDYFPQNSKGIYVKEGNDAFADKILQKKIEERGIEVLIVAGMNTKFCVNQTIGGAFRDCAETLKIEVVYDLLADGSKLHLSPEEDPLRHKTYIESSYEKEPRLAVMSSEEILKKYRNDRALYQDNDEPRKVTSAGWAKTRRPNEPTL
ncbi:MAG: isochorismatase family protein [Alphaproteobacteria bacterium]|nr:isochorismatase family protein [Alphaproteobacteria bacterium]